MYYNYHIEFSPFFGLFPYIFIKKHLLALRSSIRRR